MTAFRAGIDIGGTFTDTVIVDAEGELSYVKVPSTPPEFVEGLVNGLERGPHPLSEMTLLAHGTTVGINAIVTRRGAKAALVTTKGFRDLMAIRRGDRESFDLWWQPPKPMIPRKFRFELDERVNYVGDVLKAVDEQEVRALAARIRALDIEAVAVVFVNSPVNSEPERQVKAILEAELPDVYISASHEILPEILESERTATTTINAYIGPVMAQYVGQLEERLAAGGYTGDVTIATSAGGVATPDSVRRVPARTLESGPAAGVMAGREIARAAGFSNVVTFDMGGTSLDLGIIVDGEARRTNEYLIEWGTPVRFPSIDVFSIGAGGGSIAWIDTGGSLRNGPQSAGARPGPACYGAGGEEPTNTDAQVVLGRMRPEAFLGGEMSIDPELARQAISEKVGGPLGLGLDEAADAVIQIANNNMLQSLRLATVERGFDPREFSLFAFGGAGPLYAAEVARAGSIPTVIVPRFPGLTSALGLLLSDIRHDASRSILRTNREIQIGELNDAYAELDEQVLGMLEGEGIDRSVAGLAREIDVRYFGQSEGFTVGVPPGTLDENVLTAITDGFLERQQREFGYVMPEDFATIELVTARVSGVGAVEKVELEPVTAGGGAEGALIGRRAVYFEGSAVDTAIFSRDQLGSGDVFAGPAIVEQTDSTSVVPPGANVSVDEYGNLIIDLTGTE
ncbi:MAG: hydantoinase/oxoprolinase family protein [Gaiellaceae bacterium]